MVEIAIVCLGTWSLSSGSLPAVFVVLFLLGTHSTFLVPRNSGFCLNWCVRTESAGGERLSF